MTTDQILLSIFAGIGAIWTVFKLILPRFVDAKIKADEHERQVKMKADEYERARIAFREDKTFEMLEETLDHWKASHQEERQASADSQKLQTELVAAISQMSANVSRQTDTIRILTQEISVFGDRLRNIEDKVNVR